jgi:hypothetical protein
LPQGKKENRNDEKQSERQSKSATIFFLARREAVQFIYTKFRSLRKNMMKNLLFEKRL